LGGRLIYFDAFANDHQEDAFIALASEIAALVRASTPDNDDSNSAFKAITKAAARTLLPFAVKASIRAGTAGLLAADDIKGITEEAKALFTSAADEAAKITDSLIEERLSSAVADRESLAAFRENLSQLAQQLAMPETDGENGEPVPSIPNLIFIIDELDRCRPTFALNMLERIKHLFSVEGVCFVLVTNLGQLEAVVCGAYGDDIDARTYLEKFVQYRTSLPNRQSDEYRRKYILHLWRSMGLDSGESRLDEIIKEGFLALAEGFDLSFRSIERIGTHIALFYLATNRKRLRIAPIVICLCVMRLVNPELYRKAQDARLNWQNVEEFLRAGQWQDMMRDFEFYESWWRFATGLAPKDESDAERHKDMANEISFKYGIDDCRELQSVTARFIDDLDWIGDQDKDGS
jgi:hypothetical protein